MCCERNENFDASFSKEIERETEALIISPVGVSFYLFAPCSPSFSSLRSPSRRPRGFTVGDGQRPENTSRIAKKKRIGKALLVIQTSMEVIGYSTTRRPTFSPRSSSNSLAKSTLSSVFGSRVVFLFKIRLNPIKTDLFFILFYSPASERKTESCNFIDWLMKYLHLAFSLSQINACNVSLAIKPASTTLVCVKLALGFIHYSIGSINSIVYEINWFSLGQWLVQAYRRELEYSMTQFIVRYFD